MLLGLLFLGGLGIGAAAPARADVLELRDGRLVEGLVFQQGESYVVRSRFGVVEIPAGEVKSRTVCRPLDEQIRERLDALAPDDAENRAVLARWLVDLGREDEGRAMAEAVLELDPESALAHGVLGHVRHQGVWRTPDEAKRAEGLEKHGDRWYSRAEWENLAAAERREAEEAEAAAQAAAFRSEVNRAVRLMTSPDPNVRARGRARLEALAAEYDAPRLLDLARAVDEYVKKADELQAALAAAPSGGASGTVLGEIRATMSRLKRPIQTFETSLASSLGGGPVKIQLPELEVVRVRTTVGIPAIVR
jgi:hypothetical protein